MNETTFSAEVSIGYATASEDVRRVAQAIRTGDTLDPALLEQIGAQALSVPYVGTDSKRYVLLNDTLINLNAAAAEALVAAGADVRYTDDLMVFNALRLQQGRKLVPFPDYSPGLPFLRLYLDNGGSTEVQFKRDNSHRTPLMYAFDNLAGVLVLLEYGADPWRQPLWPEGTEMRSYFDSQVGGTANRVSAEFVFRIVHDGHLRGANAEQLSLVMETLERYLDQNLSSGRERDIYRAWCLQELAKAVIATTGVTPSTNHAQILAVDIPEPYQGWFMRPDQLVTGNEFVGPAFPDAGYFIWTHADTTVKERPEP